MSNRSAESAGTAVRAGLNDLPATEDQLGIGHYMDGLAAFLQGCQTPMTVAVQGDWGTGKTSAMQIVRNILKPPASNDADGSAGGHDGSATDDTIEVSGSTPGSTPSSEPGPRLPRRCSGRSPARSRRPAPLRRRRTGRTS